MKYGAANVFEDLYYVDPQSGLRLLIPNTEQKNIKINSHGFRSPEINLTKPDSLIRTVFLGASTTFCAEVSGNDETWPYLVNKKLEDKFPQARFDFINAAVPGYTVQSSLKLLTNKVKNFEPDMIIIYHANNDLAANTRHLAINQGLISSEPINKTSWLAKHSLLWYLIEFNFQIWKKQRNSLSNIKQLDIKSARNEKYISMKFENELLNLVNECKNVSKEVAIVTFSYRVRREQVLDEQLEAAKCAFFYMPYLNLEDLLYGYEKYNMIIKKVAQKTSVSLIEGEMEIPGDNIHFADFIHFTDEGCRLMANRVSNGLFYSEKFKRLIQK